MTAIIGVVFCIVCVMLILVILLQRGRGGGLSGAFGGAGGHSAFGAKTGDVFTWVTVALTAVFLFLSVMLVYVFVPHEYPNDPGSQLTKPPVQATQPRPQPEERTD